MKKIFIIIPAYNEEKHISEVLKKTKKYYSNIVVVDDGSRDSTYDKAFDEKVNVLRHIVNLGKGAALKTGCEFALQKGADLLVVMDTDGQHKAEDISRFVKALENVDIVFGHRQKSSVQPLILKFGNWFLNATTKVLFGMAIKDTQCGFRAFTSDAYKKIRWTSSGYDMESEMIANAGKHKLKYSEIPIETIYSDKYKGTTVLDGVRIFFKLLSWRLRIW